MTTTKRYEYHEDGGYECQLDAASMDEAIRLAEALAEQGDWGDDGALVSVFVLELDEEGEETDRRDLTVAIEPRHDRLIARATQHCDRSCGDDPDNHDWTGEGEGGCVQNPGVQALGGTTFSFRSHCRTCGLRRRELNFGPQHNADEHDTVEYEMPDKWCQECESEDCDYPVTTETE